MPQNLNLTDGSSSRQRYYALDLLRGIAALAVLCLHIDGGLGGLPYPPSGRLAVDLFFLLSGFVIAAAYDDSLRAGLGTLRFLRIRLIRLYPLYLLGSAIGVTKLLLQYRFGADPPSPARLGTDIAFAVFLLPSPTTLGRAFDSTFPIDLPAWSLSFELAVNVAFAIASPFLSRRSLMVLVSAAGALLIGVVAWQGSIEMGNTWHNLAQGLPRVVFPFFLGVLLHRIPVPGLHFPRPVLALLAGLLILVLWIDPGEGYRAVYDLTCVCLIFPALVIIGAATEVKGSGRRLSQFGGDLSYAVYILHQPILVVLLAVMTREALSITTSPLSGPMFLAGLAALCYLADRYYDQPVRRWLTVHYRKSDGIAGLVQQPRPKAAA